MNNSIKYLNNQLSTEIFKSLTSGQIINRNNYLDGIHSFNNLYIEIAENESAYKEFYSKIGYNLKAGSDFYYLANENDNSSDELRTKIVTTIIVLFRFFNHDKGYNPMYLTDESYGVTKNDIEELNDSKYIILIKGAEMKNFDNALKLLKDRGIFYISNRGNYVLTDAGFSFFSKYINSEKVFTLD